MLYANWYVKVTHIKEYYYRESKRKHPVILDYHDMDKNIDSMYVCTVGSPKNFRWGFPWNGTILSGHTIDKRTEWDWKQRRSPFCGLANRTVGADIKELDYFVYCGNENVNMPL